MDVLSQALQTVRVTSAIFFQVECLAPWGFAVPDVDNATPADEPGIGRLINFHFVIEGSASVRLADGSGFQAETGDIVIIPFGQAHTVSNGEPPFIAPGDTALAQALSGKPASIRLGGNGEPARIVCGFIGCERTADQLFLRGLPQSMRIGLRDEAGDAWLAQSIRHLVNEAESGKPGASVLLSRMAETLFIEALRRFADDLPPDEHSWLAALSDPVVASALSCLHASPLREWRLDELACETGASRSVLNRRFGDLMGETPLQYLRRWRLLLAAERLRTCSDAVAHIAADAGYRSESAFNRAFGAMFGVPPARYRNMSRRR